MNQDEQHSWSVAAAGGDEDFANFLDFNDVDLGFPQGEEMTGASTVQQDTMEVSKSEFTQEMDASQLSTPMSTAYPSGDSLADIALQQQLFQQQHSHQQHPGHQTGSHNPTIRSHQEQRTRYYSHSVVPPTPNSVEMHGAQVHSFTDPQALGMYEAGKHQDQMIFTPLVSPAFQLQEFSGPGEYFSPLTSPALQAQDYARVSLSANDGDRREATLPSSTSKKTKRRTATASKDPMHGVRSSPAMKAQQKRHSGGGKTPKEIAEIVAGLGAVQQTSPGLNANARASALKSQTNSETGSISPEPLSEVLMPPPAAPRSVNQGKFGQTSQKDLSSQISSSNAPATPASLFRTPRSSGPSTDESVKSVHQAQPLDNHGVNVSAPSTPNLSGQDSDVTRTSPVIKSVPSVNTIGTSAALASPLILDSSSPQNQPQTTNKEGNATSRSNKKRSSSSHVSPALRPRISPGIKPLLPGVANYDSEATAALLANKSNYERIIDGSASQLGVNYSAQLSENLTSKRTSHKIAEQGRRNRINTALAEIQALLPDDFGKEGVENNAGGSGGASKARTVENAIEYIRTLKVELLSSRAELATVKAQVTEMKAQIQAFEAPTSS